MTIEHYIWLDAKDNIRTRAKVNSFDSFFEDPLEWSYDGSSTGQAVTNLSDVRLIPMAHYYDNDRTCRIVVCLTGMKEYQLLTDHRLEDVLVGFEQEYTLLNSETGMVFGMHNNINHELERGNPQGDFYCSVGAGLSFGRRIAEDHSKNCNVFNIKNIGYHNEVMVGQWEYQMGPLSLLEASCQLLASRFLLFYLSEMYEIPVSLYPKVLSGDSWNGSGCHANISTRETRLDVVGGKTVNLDDPTRFTVKLIETMKKNHASDILKFGVFNELRLTGKNETSDYFNLTHGISDRSASVRIPLPAKPYIEDRRPAANCNPFEVCSVIAENILETRGL
jgi:glutamine synthetase